MAIDPRAVIGELSDLGERDRALLRRSILREPGTDPAVSRLIEPLIPEATEDERRMAYLVAALREQLPHQRWGAAGGGRRSFGAALGRLAAQGRAAGRSPANIERSIGQRFNALLDADTDGLARHLIHACALLRQEGIGFSWIRLLDDLRRWDEPGRAVQRSWVRHYVRLSRANAGATREVASPATPADSVTVADQLGVTSQHLGRLATRLGVGTRAGTGRRAVWSFTPEDIAALRAWIAANGRPRTRKEAP